MSSNTLCRLVRSAVVAVTICGLFICGYLLPRWFTDVIGVNYGLWGGYLWVGFLWITAMPCFAILVLIWKVSSAIKQDEVFTLKTARLVKTGSVLMLLAACLFFAGNVVLWLMNYSHPGILICSLLACVFGVSLAVLAAVLSRYLTKAADLQEEADGTV